MDDKGPCMLIVRSLVLARTVSSPSSTLVTRTSSPPSLPEQMWLRWTGFIITTTSLYNLAHSHNVLGVT